MIRLILILLIPLNLFCNKPATTRVLLKKLAKSVVVSVDGPYELYNPHTDELIESHSKRRKGKLIPKETGLYWGGNLNDTYEIRIVPKIGSIYVDGTPYRGTLEIYNIAGTLNLINEVDVENYLKSTLSNAPLPPLPKEALDSLVITERTNLMFFLEHGAYASWQFVASEKHYTGIPKKNSPTAAAVDRTREMILNYKKRPFPTSWGINYAGASASYSSVFRKKLVSPPGTSLISPKHKDVWKITAPLQKLLDLTDLPSCSKIDLFHAKKSQKVYGLRLIHESSHADIDFSTLHKAFNLKSNDFKVTMQGGEVIFEGNGQGLGVGLCLTSAEMLAKQGYSSEKILMKHFPDTQLINLTQVTGKESSKDPIWN